MKFSFYLIILFAIYGNQAVGFEKFEKYHHFSRNVSFDLNALFFHHLIN